MGTALLLSIICLALTQGGCGGKKTGPFWIGKSHDQWSLEESEQMLQDSPWTKHVYRSRVATGGLHDEFLVRLFSARPVQLARAGLVQRLPHEIPGGRVGWGEPVLNAEPIDKVEAERYVKGLSWSDEVVVEVFGGHGYWDRLNGMTLEDLKDWTFLRFRCPGREVKVSLGAFVPPKLSPVGEALFRFPRPQGITAPGTLEFVTELPTRNHWPTRRFHLQIKARFSLEEMLFERQLSF